MLGKILNTFGTRLISAILNLLIAIIISRVLGPDGKGVQGLIITTIAYILVFANLMGGGAIVFLTPKFQTSAIVIPAYLWSAVSGLLFFMGLSFFELVDEEMIYHICLLAVISAFTAINSSVLIGREKIAPSNLIALVQPLIVSIGLIVFFYVMGKMTIWAYVSSLYAGFFLSFMVSLVYLRRFGDGFTFRSLAEYWQVVVKMIQYGLLNQLAHVFQLLSFRMSYYWLEQLFSEKEVGIYSNGTNLVESIWLISRSISMVQYARIANSTDKEYAQKLTVNLTFAGLVLSMLLLLILVLLPAELFVLIFGPGFGEVGLVIQSLAPGVLFFNIALIMGHYFSGIGKYHVNTIASFAGLIISVILFSIMIPVYGITGAGWATSISYFVTSVVVFVWFYKEAKLKPLDYIPEKKEIKEIFSSLAAYLSRKK
jgi:O-antigen/teichoic acid export membrane protein